MKIREHRGYLADSMKTVKDIGPTKADLIAHLKETLKECDVIITPLTVTVEYYGYDDRIGWETYIVKIKNWGVYGFTDALPQGC
jgi:hypothetical protein